MDIDNRAKLREVAKLTLVGTIFVGLGSVLSVYMPALQGVKPCRVQKRRTNHSHVTC